MADPAWLEVQRKRRTDGERRLLREVVCRVDGVVTYIPRSYQCVYIAINDKTVCSAQPYNAFFK